MTLNNKLISVHILEILNKYSDENNRLTQKEIMEFLENEYGESISRHTCSSYLKELRDNGYIIGSYGVYKKELISERQIRVLIDSIMYAKHIPKKEAEILILKLKELSSFKMKNKAKYLNYFTGINRTVNEDIYSILDIIDDAIERDLKIEICQYSPLPDGTRSEWNPKIVDPYFIVSDQSRYYLLCNTYRNGNNLLEPRRIDRFSTVKIIVEKRTPLIDVVDDEFDLGKYMREHIYMFSGNISRIKIRIKTNKIGVLIDWCGTDYILLDTNDEYTDILVNTNEEAMYYWALQYGKVAEVLEPTILRERIKTGLENILEKYK